MIEAYVLAGELHRAGGDIVRALAAFEARLRSFVTLKQKMPHFYMDKFAQDRKVENIRDMFTVQMLVNFVKNKLAA